MLTCLVNLGYTEGIFSYPGAKMICDYLKLT